MNRWKFAAALILAALCSDIFTADPYRRAWRALRAILGYTGKGGKVADELYAKRMECCRRCPIYHHGMETCGSPLSANPDLGCSCFMPIKAKLVESQCWGSEEYGPDWPFGWDFSARE